MVFGSTQALRNCSAVLDALDSDLSMTLASVAFVSPQCDGFFESDWSVMVTNAIETNSNYAVSRLGGSSGSRELGPNDQLDGRRSFLNVMYIYCHIYKLITNL